MVGGGGRGGWGGVGDGVGRIKCSIGGGGLSRFLRMGGLVFGSFSYNNYMKLRDFSPKFAI